MRRSHHAWQEGGLGSGLMLELHGSPQMPGNRGEHGSDLRYRLVRSEQTRVLVRLALHDDDVGRTIRGEQPLSQLCCDPVCLPIALERSSVDLEKVNARTVRKADRVV